MAILYENGGAQSRLSQVFVKQASDNYLEFTVHGAALRGQANGPDDAFEAALLSAVTGQAVTAGIGMNRSDAFLNLQGTGRCYESAGLVKRANADGSLTYVLDVGAIANGTALELVFDLVGFGEAASQVMIRDVRMSGMPEVHDDAVSLNEDSAITVDVRANDLNAGTVGFAPVVVTAPQHGVLTLLDDGRFHYQPLMDFAGEDTFSYALTNGQVTTTAATVNVTVIPVNDAPVALDDSVTGNEDTTLSGNVFA